MTAKLTDFLPDVMPEVSDCPEPTAVNAVRSSIHRLCSFAPVWQQTSAPFSVSANQAQYPLLSVGQVPSYADVVRVMAPILVNGGERKIYPTPRLMLDRQLAGWNSLAAAAVQTYFIEGVRTLRLVPTPDATNTDALTLQLWLRPRDGAVEVDDILLFEYRTLVAEGAKARLMAMSRQPWSDPAEALFYGRKFNSGLMEAYARVYKDYTEGDLAVQMRPLA